MPHSPTLQAQISPSPQPGTVPSDQLDRKQSIEMVEQAPEKGADEPRVELSAADNKRLLRKIDRRVLPLLFGVYLLQILDKFVFGYGNIYGMSEELGLQGTQYGLASTMNNIAQLAWMPFSTYLIVKVPFRILMPTLIFCWGASQACMAASNGFAALAATRFLLGLFEAGCLPLFSVITAHWYRRSEQPFRVALWYCTVGFGQITASILSFALGKANSPHVSSWRMIFMIVGIITVCCAPLVWWKLDSDITSARFLTPEEKEQCIERVRANQTGTGSKEFKWSHIVELLYDPKTYLFGGLSLCANFGATVATAFGPTLLRDTGFSREEAALLNAPFGALQTCTILFGSYLAQRLKLKGICLIIMMTPVLIGTILLYVGNVQEVRNTKMALAGYYMLAPLWSANPLIVSWMISNTGGQTKKSGILSIFNAFNAAGSIAGPVLYNANDAPRYLPGLRGTMGVFCAMMGVNVICFGMIFLLNKTRERQRVGVGKPAKIRDTSMLTNYETFEREGGLGEFADKDVTDFRNNEFVYVN